MTTIVIPRLAGTRDAFRQLLDDQGVPAVLSGQTVVVLCREVVSGSSSYADEVVHQVLGVRGARELVLVGGPPLFTGRVLGAAERRGLAGRVRTGAAADVMS
jgi:hypothetical protein